jgi:hypothetical protein
VNLEPAWLHSKTLSQKNTRGWWSGSSGSKHKALSSNPNTTKIPTKYLKAYICIYISIYITIQIKNVFTENFHLHNLHVLILKILIVTEWIFIRHTNLSAYALKFLWKIIEEHVTFLHILIYIYYCVYLFYFCQCQKLTWTT